MSSDAESDGTRFERTAGLELASLLSTCEAGKLCGLPGLTCSELSGVFNVEVRTPGGRVELMAIKCGCGLRVSETRSHGYKQGQILAGQGQYASSKNDRLCIYFIASKT